MAPGPSNAELIAGDLQVDINTLRKKNQTVEGVVRQAIKDHSTKYVAHILSTRILFDTFFDDPSVSKELKEEIRKAWQSLTPADKAAIEADMDKRPEEIIIDPRSRLERMGDGLKYAGQRTADGFRSVGNGVRRAWNGGLQRATIAAGITTGTVGLGTLGYYGIRALNAPEPPTLEQRLVRDAQLDMPMPPEQLLDFVRQSRNNGYSKIDDPTYHLDKMRLYEDMRNNPRKYLKFMRVLLQEAYGDEFDRKPPKSQKSLRNLLDEADNAIDQNKPIHYILDHMEQHIYWNFPSGLKFDNADKKREHTLHREILPDMRELVKTFGNARRPYHQKHVTVGQGEKKASIAIYAWIDSHELHIECAEDGIHGVSKSNKKEIDIDLGGDISNLNFINDTQKEIAVPIGSKNGEPVIVRVPYSSDNNREARWFVNALVNKIAERIEQEQDIKMPWEPWQNRIDNPQPQDPGRRPGLRR